MTLYVQGRAGPHLLLLPAIRVLEVWSAGSSRQPGQWRERTLPVINLRQLLAGDGRRTDVRTDETLAAYGADADDDEAVVLALDAVIGLMTLEPAALVPLPAVSLAARQLFDAVTRAPIGERHLLRLRERPEFASVATR
ncbi:MAG: hypothetical protein FJX35_10840 [Alphaproteobacteria bacterium]|nr:hypothetical protein [Alphaproteobacteria bacterium]